MGALPSFDQLPVSVGAPAHSSWGVWGDGHLLGCWNNIDAAATRRGVSCVRAGKVFSLNAPYDPALTDSMGRPAHRHRIEPKGGAAWDDVIDGFNTQGSTQWDGFGHAGSPVYGHYGGLSRDDHGVQHWAAHGFATRGVLADIGRWRDEQGRPLDLATDEMVPVDELVATLEQQGSEVLPGDILLLRFGWLGWWRQHRPHVPGPLAFPGIEPSLEAARLLWDLHVAAVGGDPGLDPLPGRFGRLTAPPSREDLADPAFGFQLTLHTVLPMLGLSIGEYFDLDALAQDCAAAGDWTFLITSAPMQLPGGVATPANALAIR